MAFDALWGGCLKKVKIPKDHHRQVRHIEGCLDAFIGGNYTTLIGWWRSEVERAGRMRKPRKPQSPDQRWDLCVQQIVRSFVGTGLKNGGRGDG